MPAGPTHLLTSGTLFESLLNPAAPVSRPAVLGQLLLLVELSQGSQSLFASELESARRERGRERSSQKFNRWGWHPFLQIGL